METGIGVTLREARNRRRVDLSEAEAATKIRIRFLRAMENEEWDVLPGGAYTRAFIRTYASYLGLDGERLADEFRRDTAPLESERAPRVQAAGSVERHGPRGSGRVWIVLVALGLVGLLIGIGLTGEGENAPRGQGATGPGGQAERPEASTTSDVAARPGVALQLAATGEVWVCLLDAGGEPLVEGQILEAGAEEGPFRSPAFSVSFGNGEATMTIDGEEAEIPATSSPIGYEIDSDGELSELSEGERPTCE